MDIEVSKKTKTFFFLFFTLAVISILLTFYKYMVKEDFAVVNTATPTDAEVQ